MSDDSDEPKEVFEEEAKLFTWNGSSFVKIPQPDSIALSKTFVPKMDW